MDKAPGVLTEKTVLNRLAESWTHGAQYSVDVTLSVTSDWGCCLASILVWQDKRGHDDDFVNMSDEGQARLQERLTAEMGERRESLIPRFSRNMKLGPSPSEAARLVVQEARKVLLEIPGDVIFKLKAPDLHHRASTYLECRVGSAAALRYVNTGLGTRVSSLFRDLKDGWRVDLHLTDAIGEGKDVVRKTRPGERVGARRHKQVWG